MRWAASARSPASRASSSSSPTSATSDGWTRALGRAGARATRCWPSRSATRASASCPPVGRLAVVDPETGERVEIDTSRARVRERFAALERERREGVARELRRLHVDHVELSTDRDWLLDLGRRLR